MSYGNSTDRHGFYNVIRAEWAELEGASTALKKGTERVNGEVWEVVRGQRIYWAEYR